MIYLYKARCCLTCIVLIITLFFFDTKVNAQQLTPCDTFGLQQLSTSLKHNSNNSLIGPLDQLIKEKNARQEPLPEFILCPNQDQQYTQTELKQMVLLATDYMKHSKFGKAKKLLQEVVLSVSPDRYYPFVANAYNYLGVISDKEKDWVSAYFYFYKLLKWEKENRVELNASAYLNIGALYTDLGAYKKADQLLQKALSLPVENTLEHGWLFYHLGKLAIVQNEYPKAEEYLQAANQIWERKEEALGACFTNIQLGKVHESINTPEQNMAFIKEILKQSNDVRCKAFLLFDLGILYLNNNQPAPAQKYFQECELIVVKENYPNLQLKLYGQMIKLGFLTGETNETALLFKKFTHLNDSLSNTHRRYIINSLDQAKQLIEKQQEMNVLIHQEKYTVANLRLQRIISIAAIGLFMMSTLLAGLFFRFNRKNKKSNQTLLKLNKEITQQKEALGLATTKIQEQKAELEYQLVNKAIEIGQYGEVIHKVEQLLQSEHFHSQKSAILKELVHINPEKIKEDLNLQISNTNQHFFQILSTQYPGLSQSDLRLCAFLKMNLTTKEIAEITLKSPESIKVARSRLRKKLGLTHQKIAVSVFLNQLLNAHK